MRRFSAPRRARTTVGVLFAVAAVLGSAAAPGEAAAAEAFRDSFDEPGVLEEAGSVDESPSPDWWLNSGARFVRAEGTGRTIQGALPAGDPWRTRYSRSSARDTDTGRLPQNLFRLVTRRQWLDSTVTVRVRIRETHLTETPNRGEWSGVLLFSRYVDSDNLYYAGVRQDGTAVVKRKRSGEYATLAEGRVIEGLYHRTKRPNLLPAGRWIGLRLVTRTESDGHVRLRLDVRDLVPGSGWVTVLAALDDGSKGGRPIDRKGASGVRSDYMDVELDDFEVAVPG